MKATAIVVTFLGIAAALAAQAPPPAPQQAGAPPGQRQGGGGGGRGGGRGAVPVLTLSTTAWTDGGTVPINYTQAGTEVSPPLAWTMVEASPPAASLPAGAAPPAVPPAIRSFSLIVHDVDAPTADLANDTLHWMVWNIPGTARALPEHVPQGPDLADGSKQISATGPYYRGPAAPATDPPHHYVFDLYALDTVLDVMPVGATVVQTRAAVMAAMAGHVRGKATLVGRFRYPAPTAAK